MCTSIVTLFFSFVRYARLMQRFKNFKETARKFRLNLCWLNNAVVSTCLGWNLAKVPSMHACKNTRQYVYICRTYARIEDDETAISYCSYLCINFHHFALVYLYCLISFNDKLYNKRRTQSYPQEAKTCKTHLRYFSKFSNT